MNITELNGILADIQIELRNRVIEGLEEMVADSFMGTAGGDADADNNYSIEPEGKVMRYSDSGAVMRKMREAGRGMESMDKYGPNASSFPATSDAKASDGESSTRMCREDRGDVDHSIR